MALVTVVKEGRVLSDPDDISTFLSQFGIWYRHSESGASLPENATQEEVLSAFDAPIQELKAEGGFVTADVIDVSADTPGLDEMLAKFDKEHAHDDDEVRFIVLGSGIFHIHPDQGPVFSIEVATGDMINVPKQTRHWFHLCEERTIRAIRLFKDAAGWVPKYTESGVDAMYEPLCFGPSHLAPGP